MKKRLDFGKDVAIWLDFSRYDLKTARWDLRGKIYTSACYASQQTAEKALKALILSGGKVAPKVHSLDRLMTELRESGVNIDKIEKSTQELDKFYISSRYPGQYGGPEGLYNEADALAAISAAEKILKFVEENIS